MKLLSTLNAWVLKDDVRTWVAHALIALLLTPVFGAKIAIGYYLLREGEQVLYRLIRREPLHPVDHVMDVLAPAAAVGMLTLFV